jgi:prolyl-tRNA editing enzyme YbaK/EbsC (Cys-tRNA(Pro) deacylase)
MAMSIDSYRMSLRRLPQLVVSCADAAQVKGISLENELKTLILLVSRELCCVHVRGDLYVDLRKVKQYMNAKEARLAPLESLVHLGVQPGTVSPYVDEIAALPHLVCESLLRADFLSTNAGRLDRCIFLSVENFLGMLKGPISLGDFSRKLRVQQPLR